MERLSCLAFLALLAAAGCRAYYVTDLVETVLSDPQFWQTENQTWSELDPRICVYDPTGMGGRGLCKTNIGYYIHAAGMNATVIAQPAMQFYLRFQMRDACHAATFSDTLGGTYCAVWGEDWSRVPLSGLVPNKFNVSTLCRTVHLNSDPAQPGLGCANNYAPYSLESDADWAYWFSCYNAADPIGTDKCRQAQFERLTGWNFTVLDRMVDAILQNGNDCQKEYEGKQDDYPPSEWLTVCEAGASPPPPLHQVLSALYVYKNFTATYAQPWNPYANFAPPPPNPPNPPPSPPSPPSPPPPPPSPPNPPSPPPLGVRVAAPGAAPTGPTGSPVGPGAFLNVTGPLGSEAGNPAPALESSLLAIALAFVSFLALLA